MKLIWFWAGSCLASSVENGIYVDVGNQACPPNTTTLASKAECAEAAETIWPRGGCYSQPWKAIVKSLPDGSSYPAGCMYEVSEGGGCALLLQTDGKAEKAKKACSAMWSANTALELESGATSPTTNAARIRQVPQCSAFPWAMALCASLGSVCLPEAERGSCPIRLGPT
eukprot:CAMPEP_0114670012 /NCGR_PEP_ID=MMETSP0191-20121206/38934_1 /TAXON_ID=126664 /ORGANISM="Sorites sp." /LENGTH=169 /DNA_ID=CAMNT_0001926833 /DNA_START=25 /DNA_END=531 /DNA_ORIENTATION=+